MALKNVLLSDGGGSSNKNTNNGTPNRYTTVATPSTAKSEGPIYQSMTGSAPKYTKTTTPTGGYTGGTTTYVDNSGGSDSGTMDRIIDLLKQQQEASKNYYNALYQQELNNATTGFNNNRDAINKEYKLAERRYRGMFGNLDEGRNWTNRGRIMQNWLSKLADNRSNFETTKNSIAMQRDLGLANSANTMAQGWYNYVLPYEDYLYKKSL